MRRLLLAAMGLALVVSAPAHAAPAWLPSGAVPGSADPSREPEAAFGPDGTLVVAWAEESGADARIRTATRPPGGPFGAATTLAGPASGLGSPRLAIANDGTTLITWGQGTEVRYAVRPPGGAFGAPADIPAPAGENASSAAEIAFDSQGDALALWVTTQPESGGIRFRLRASLRPRGGAFESPALLENEFSNADAPGTPSFNLSGLDVAAAGSDLLVAWHRFCCHVGSETAAIRVATRPAGEDLGTPQTVDSAPGTGSVFGSRLAGSANRSAVLIWSRQPTPATGSVVGCAKPPGGSFAGCAVENVSPAGTFTSNASVGIDAQGNAVAAWSREVPTTLDNSVVQTAARRGGAWSSIGTFSEPGIDLTMPSLAMSPGGSAILAWRRGLNRMDGAHRPAGGSFGGSRPLSTPGGSPIFPELAMDPAGNGAGVWERSEGMSSSRVQVAGFDGAGPRLGALSVPATGRTGRRLSFGLQAVDVWSPVQSIGWAFGDGANGSGGQVTHVYRGTGGNFTVGVTATDSLGNSTSASRAVRVRDATRPVLSRLRMRPRRFAVGRARTPLVAQRLRRGSAFRFRLSERATVKIRIGRRTITRRGRRAGGNRIKFSGRIKRKALAPGAHRATLRAIDRAGNRSRARRVRFVIAAPR